MPAPELRK
jgi:hypothetical protein